MTSSMFLSASGTASASSSLRCLVHSPSAPSAATHSAANAGSAASGSRNWCAESSVSFRLRSEAQHTVPSRALHALF